MIDDDDLDYDPDPSEEMARALMSEWTTDNASGESAVDYAEFVNLQITARRALLSLSPRAEYVLRNRFGFDGEELTLSDIGERLGIGRERVRNIEQGAIRRLRGHRHLVRWSEDSDRRRLRAEEERARFQRAHAEEPARRAREDERERVEKARREQWRRDYDDAIGEQQLSRPSTVERMSAIAAARATELLLLDAADSQLRPTLRAYYLATVRALGRVR